MPEFPELQRQNLLLDLNEEIQRVIDETDHPHEIAFREVALNWLGLVGGDLNEVEDEKATGYRTDAKGDRGIDFYVVSDGSLQIYQSKGSEEDVSSSWSKTVGVNAIKDIPRIVNYIRTADEPKEKQNRFIQKFQKNLLHQLALLKSRKGQPEPVGGTSDADFLTISIHLIISGRGLTPQAEEEINEVAKANSVIEVNGCEILLDFNVITVDHLLGERWALTNTKWRDREGKNKDTFSADIRGSVISDTNMKVFFARAKDLVDAYHDFGQRLFETNVRCHFKKSDVNDKIANQIKTKKGINEFYLLNNGVTIIATSISAKDGRATFVQPGIVNGLQTVTTLAKTYLNKLNPELKKYFEENCYVLVRAYEKRSIPDINKLVVATNNQNLMEARNLRSNELIQINLERQFAELKWFYERKQFAWNAFQQEHQSWPTLNRFRPRDFESGKGANVKYKVADNEFVAQAWLAFIGYTNEAMHEKRKIFSDAGPDYYKRVFETWPKKHAADLEFRFTGPEVDESLLDQAAPPQGLLFAYLLYKTAKLLTPSNANHRAEMEAKLKIQNKSKEERDKILIERPDYLVGLIKNTSTYIFVEMVGYILFKKFGNDLPKIFTRLLHDTDMFEIYSSYEVGPLKQSLENGRFKENALIAQSWLLFEDLLTDLVYDEQWKRSYYQASSRPRLIYSSETRCLIIKRLSSHDQLLKSGRTLQKSWSEFADRRKSLFGGLFTL